MRRQGASGSEFTGKAIERIGAFNALKSVISEAELLKLSLGGIIL